MLVNFSEGGGEAFFQVWSGGGEGFFKLEIERPDQKFLSSIAWPLITTVCALIVGEGLRFCKDLEMVKNYNTPKRSENEVHSFEAQFFFSKLIEME